MPLGAKLHEPVVGGIDPRAAPLTIPDSSLCLADWKKARNGAVKFQELFLLRRTRMGEVENKVNHSGKRGLTR